MDVDIDVLKSGLGRYSSQSIYSGRFFILLIGIRPLGKARHWSQGNDQADKQDSVNLVHKQGILDYKEGYSLFLKRLRAFPIYTKVNGLVEAIWVILMPGTLGWSQLAAYSIPASSLTE